MSLGTFTVGTPEDRQAFIEALEDCANVTQSAEKVGFSRRTLYNWRAADPDFAADWDRAVQQGLSTLEDEAIRRGRDGYDKPVYQGGEMVGTIREYSDTLLIFMLKGGKPEKYRDNVTTRVVGANDGPVQIEDVRAPIGSLIAGVGKKE